MPCEVFSLGSVSETAALDAVNVGLGSLSLLACSAVFLGYCWRRRRCSIFLLDPQSMVLMLACSDFFLGLASLLEGLYPAHKACEEPALMDMCTLKACLSQFFGLASFCWSAAMAHSSHSQISGIFSEFAGVGSRGSVAKSKQYSMLVYHCYCWGLPFLSLLIMLATQSAGPASSHVCWVIASRSSSNDSQLSLPSAVLLFVLPLIAVELYNVSVFRWLVATIRQLPSAAMRPLLSRVQRLLAVLVGCKLLFLATRCLRLLYPDNSNFLLALLVTMGAPLQGVGDYYIFSSGNNNGSTSLGSSRHAGSSSRGVGGAVEDGSVGVDVGVGGAVAASATVEMRSGYSTVRNPLSTADSELDVPSAEEGLPGSAHSAAGLLSHAQEGPRSHNRSTGSMLVSANEGEDDDDAFGSYAFLEGDSSHSHTGSGLGLGVLADGCHSDDEDQYEEVVLCGGLDSGATDAGGVHTGHAEHDPYSRRASDVSLLGGHL